MLGERLVSNVKNSVYQAWIEGLDTDLASKIFIKNHNLEEHELFDAAGKQNSV